MHLCVIIRLVIFDLRLPLTLMFPIVWMSLRQSWLLHINAYLFLFLFVFVVYFCLYLLCTRCGFPWRFVWWAVRLSLMAASFHLCTSPILCPQRGRDFRQEQDLFVIFAKCISSGRFFIPCTDFSLILEISLSRIFRHVSFSDLIFCHSWMPFLRFLGYNLECKRYQNYLGFLLLWQCAEIYFVVIRIFPFRILIHGQDGFWDVSKEGNLWGLTRHGIHQSEWLHQSGSSD